MKANLDKDLEALEVLEARWGARLQGFSQQYKGVVVACSGGLDSTVLFHKIRKITKEKINFRLAICHINFGLRGEESQRDATFVESLAAKAGCAFFGSTVGPGEECGEQNTQVWARTLRYRRFQALAAQGWLIALAHHRDDLAESVLLRLARGTSPGAMAGMREWHPPYWRPFLNLPKAQLRAWAEAECWPACEDSSNALSHYSRNRLRHDVLPLLEGLAPGAAQRIGRCAQAAWDLAEYVTRSLAEPIHRLSTGGLSCQWLAQQGETIGLLVVSQACGPLQRGRKGLTFSFLQQIWQLVVTVADSKPELVAEVQLPAGGGWLCVRAGKLFLKPCRSAAGLGAEQQSGSQSLKTRQHQRSLGWQHYEWGQGVSCQQVQFFTARPAGQARLGLSWAAEEKSSQHLSVFPVRGDERLRFATQDRPWTLKELMVINGIPHAARAHLFLAVASTTPSKHEDLKARGLWVLQKFRQPDARGRLI